MATIKYGQWLKGHNTELHYNYRIHSAISYFLPYCFSDNGDRFIHVTSNDLHDKAPVLEIQSHNFDQWILMNSMYISKNTVGDYNGIRDHGCTQYITMDGHENATDSLRMSICNVFDSAPPLLDAKSYLDLAERKIGVFESGELTLDEPHAEREIESEIMGYLVLRAWEACWKRFMILSSAKGTLDSLHVVTTTLEHEENTLKDGLNFFKNRLGPLMPAPLMSMLSISIGTRYTITNSWKDSAVHIDEPRGVVSSPYVFDFSNDADGVNTGYAKTDNWVKELSRRFARRELPKYYKAFIEKTNIPLLRANYNILILLNNLEVLLNMDMSPLLLEQGCGFLGTAIGMIMNPRFNLSLKRAQAHGWLSDVEQALLDKCKQYKGMLTKRLYKFWLVIYTQVLDDYPEFANEIRELLAAQTRFLEDEKSSDNTRTSLEMVKRNIEDNEGIHEKLATMISPILETMLSEQGDQAISQTDYANWLSYYALPSAETSVTDELNRKIYERLIRQTHFSETGESAIVLINKCGYQYGTQFPGVREKLGAMVSPILNSMLDEQNNQLMSPIDYAKWLDYYVRPSAETHVTKEVKERIFERLIKQTRFSETGESAIALIQKREDLNDTQHISLRRGLFDTELDEIEKTSAPLTREEYHLWAERFAECNNYGGELVVRLERLLNGQIRFADSNTEMPLDIAKEYEIFEVTSQLIANEVDDLAARRGRLSYDEYSRLLILVQERDITDQSIQIAKQVLSEQTGFDDDSEHYCCDLVYDIGLFDCWCDILKLECSALADQRYYDVSDTDFSRWFNCLIDERMTSELSQFIIDNLLIPHTAKNRIDDYIAQAQDCMPLVYAYYAKQLEDINHGSNRMREENYRLWLVRYVEMQNMDQQVIRDGIFRMLISREVIAGSSNPLKMAYEAGALDVLAVLADRNFRSETHVCTEAEYCNWVEYYIELQQLRQDSTDELIQRMANSLPLCQLRDGASTVDILEDKNALDLVAQAIEFEVTNLNKAGNLKLSEDSFIRWLNRYKRLANINIGVAGNIQDLLANQYDLAGTQKKAYDLADGMVDEKLIIRLIIKEFEITSGNAIPDADTYARYLKMYKRLISYGEISSSAKVADKLCKHAEVGGRLALDMALENDCAVLEERLLDRENNERHSDYSEQSFELRLERYINGTQFEQEYRSLITNQRQNVKLTWLLKYLCEHSYSNKLDRVGGLLALYAQEANAVTDEYIDALIELNDSGLFKAQIDAVTRTILVYCKHQGMPIKVAELCGDMQIKSAELNTIAVKTIVDGSTEGTKILSTYCNRIYDDSLAESIRNLLEEHYTGRTIDGEIVKEVLGAFVELGFNTMHSTNILGDYIMRAFTGQSPIDGVLEYVRSRDAATKNALLQKIGVWLKKVVAQSLNIPVLLVDFVNAMGAGRDENAVVELFDGLNTYVESDDVQIDIDDDSFKRIEDVFGKMEGYFKFMACLLEKNQGSAESTRERFLLYAIENCVSLPEKCSQLISAKEEKEEKLASKIFREYKSISQLDKAIRNNELPAWLDEGVQERIRDELVTSLRLQLIADYEARLNSAREKHQPTPVSRTLVELSKMIPEQYTILRSLTLEALGRSVIDNEQQAFNEIIMQFGIKDTNDTSDIPTSMTLGDLKELLLCCKLEHESRIGIYAIGWCEDFGRLMLNEAMDSEPGLELIGRISSLRGSTDSVKQFCMRIYDQFYADPLRQRSDRPIALLAIARANMTVTMVNRSFWDVYLSLSANIPLSDQEDPWVANYEVASVMAVKNIHAYITKHLIRDGLISEATLSEYCRNTKKVMTLCKRDSELRSIVHSNSGGVFGRLFGNH